MLVTPVARLAMNGSVTSAARPGCARQLRPVLTIAPILRCGLCCSLNVTSPPAANQRRDVLRLPGPTALSGRLPLAQVHGVPAQGHTTEAFLGTRQRHYRSFRRAAETDEAILAQDDPYFVKRLTTDNTLIRTIWVGGDCEVDVAADDVETQFARSSGPGGQNVNKVNTKVDMRLDLDGAAWLSEEVKAMVRQREKNRINKNGYLIVASQAGRSQLQNLEDALARIQSILDTCADLARPREMDEATKKKLKAQKKKANENRLKTKKKKGDKKKGRREGKRAAMDY